MRRREFIAGIGGLATWPAGSASKRRLTPIGNVKKFLLSLA
jgi:hypothetical protein